MLSLPDFRDAAHSQRPPVPGIAFNDLESKSPARGIWPNGYCYEAIRIKITHEGMRGSAIARCHTAGCTSAWEYVQHAGEVGAEWRHIGGALRVVPPLRCGDAPAGWDTSSKTPSPTSCA